jgi:hypothetical protein
MKEQNPTAHTSIKWCAITDGKISVEIDCLLVAAPGVLTKLAKSFRLMAEAQDPEGLAAADAVNAAADEIMDAAIKAQGEG